MLIDGINLVEGSDAENLTIASGTLTERGSLTPTNGELFYQTDNTPGLYAYINGAWSEVALNPIDGGSF